MGTTTEVVTVATLSSWQQRQTEQPKFLSTAVALCQFRNVSSRMVILRCVGPETFFQEKVIVPFEAWQWSCPPQSRVDIWSHSLTRPDLVESFPAEAVAISCDLPARECSPDVKPEGRISPEVIMIPLAAIPALSA